VVPKRQVGLHSYAFKANLSHTD